ncbi:MAG: DUF1549 domain-containing protein, partial [Acidobacteria bacterium]|nr:DUF1549 domain-containing protein [Acidobacteriota bacterium]
MKGVRLIRAAFLLCLLVTLVSAQDAVFDAKVAPILRARCVGCHSGASAQGGLDVTSVASILRGGKSGPAVVMGAAARSLLVERTVSKTMPPGGMPKLNDAEIGAIRAWIEQGKAATAQVNVTEADVIPILQMRCTVCHGKRKQEAGLDLRTRESVLRGGRSGPAIVPGKPEASLLLKRIAAGQMPPPKLLFEYFVRPPSTPEVEVVRQWIVQGAKSAPPRAEVVDVAPAAAPSWWSFRAPVRAAVPAVRHKELVVNPIDAFLLAKLEGKGLGFAAPASRMALMRRVYLDLTGLPPSPAEIDAYERDKDPRAYENLVDRLLASRHYGERWAQFWLNNAGYSDSEGIIDEDRIRPNAWRYRDYVIRALNADKPFDRFLTEQIAGDELGPYQSLGNPSLEDLDRLTATGFLRLVPDGTYSPANGSVPERMNVIADEIEVLGSSVMGLTVGCARCHDHKYDP